MSFTDRSLEDHRASLNVAISASSNGRHLVRYLGPTDPFFYLGDTAWELPHRLSIGEAELYLRNRSEKGFNAVMIVLLAEHGGLDHPNRDGEWPFFPHSNSNATSYQPDLSRPNPAYFAFIDSLTSLAASLDITLVLVPTWGRYINGGYYGPPVLFDRDTAYTYGRFLGERYPFHPFVLGGDSNRFWVESWSWANAASGGKDVLKDNGPVIESMAKGLLEGEKAARNKLVTQGLIECEEYIPFLTYHSAQLWLPDTVETTSSAQFPDATWLGYDVVQTGHHDTYRTGEKRLPRWFARSSYIPIRKMYATKDKSGRPRPIMDMEPHYENTRMGFIPEEPLWTAKDIRNGGWQAIFAGACGYTYGVNSIWQMHNAESKTHPPIQPPTTAFNNWYLELDLPGAYQASLFRHIMQSLPNFFSRIPDQSFILSDTHEPTDGTPAGDALISGMRSEGWAMVHLPYGGGVTIDLTKAGFGEKKSWRAWWIDPRTGGREVFMRDAGGGVTQTFQAPSGGDQDDDWLLLVEEDIWPPRHDAEQQR
ncbi:hypothetical protein IAR55_006736 [Kwoniella newhampshirensis]|uniref:DUF4038 domain-containing protein n=1 Tax=Kwoniella newhampshirensis TaxID=1651941 RepID=A0AAW0YTL7_9TREE